MLKTLADPIRLKIVDVLADDRFHPCSVQEYDLGIHKSTLSYHLKTMREAGVTITRINGREHGIQLRRDHLDARFPGLINSILESRAKRDHHRLDPPSVQ